MNCFLLRINLRRMHVKHERMRNCYNFNPIKDFKSCLYSRGLYENVSVAFDYLKFETGNEVYTENLPKNYIIAFLSGEHEVTGGSIGKHLFKSGDLVCLPRHSKISGITRNSGEIITISFDIPLSHCDQRIIHNYLTSQPMQRMKITTIPIRQAMKCFFDMMRYLIDNERVCLHLHKIKLDEFFILLRGFYKKSEVISFLGPAILGMSEFSIYIYSHYHTAANLQELIENSCYSRAVFYRKFKENFGTLTPQRWFNIQKRSQFLDVGSALEMTPKVMMHKLNLRSMSTMTRLCKDLFDCSPNALIKKLKY